ncbi:cbb3-type cytochrome oxidase assembly protein CcoS [Rhizobium sp. ARZ01]|uniref:cbb3-type cytochrome oxidase assembly protein CcoS n=1 Tax=Rhizobium sp. ARZ01 TaxID=2769313 RepID=UPI00177E9CB8|nr:cbb3-type cytochrome oxidase assembly protein CcoS [Rhizobium sp. ARZ01]MBD9372693.1 cbb3-type cytochrome oxidase assembly protein CcoS [Rhizobium sp. ARZ01]
MSAIYYLIPVSLFLGTAALLMFLWSLRSGQYDDLDGAAERILYDEDVPAPPAKEIPADDASKNARHAGALLK